MTLSPHLAKGAEATRQLHWENKILQKLNFEVVFIWDFLRNSILQIFLWASEKIWASLQIIDIYFSHLEWEKGPKWKK